MLRLLPNVLYSKGSERRSFLQKLFIFVLSLHLLFFIVPACISFITKKHDTFTIKMHQAGATYVLMPLQKNVTQNNVNTAQSNMDASKKSQVIGYEEYLKTKRNQKKISSKGTKVAEASEKKEQKIEPIKKTKSKSTAILADRTFAKKHLANKKLSNIKNKKNLKNKKQIKNKVKIVAQKQNSAIETKKTAEVMQEEPIIENSPLKNDQIVDDPSVASQETLAPLSDNVIFVGYEQLDECIIGSKIQHAIVQNWTPPVGLEQGVSCEMKITVSSEGASNSIEVIKSSGILMFDISARNALEEIEFPKEVHGRTIMLVLAN